VVGIGINNNADEEKIQETQINHKRQKLCGNPNKKKSQSRMQIHYYQRDYRREEVNPHSRSV